MSDKQTVTQTPSYNNVLSINRLGVDVRLGITEKEQQKPQRVILDIRFYIPSLMSSSVDDNGEYICYHGISEKIYALCVSKPYRLIEYLAQEVYRLIRSETADEVKIGIKLQKTRILLPYVEDGATFAYTDLPPHSWVVPD